MLQWLSRKPWWYPRPVRSEDLLREWGRELAGELESKPEEERPLGCGWFDSSHELERGLQVREADAEALSALPLGDWLDLHLHLQSPGRSPLSC